ncbi:hypothetical protein M0813_10703 [Anaeramoeba flamelloides]|uniref:Uncharacterized protein n=1 Tax=Anaeramoeba flamelloides TaxID=1746091 RepID=A0ABQ8X242_9EUKA|nr:hypothetical protein M0813_10703 [Anaeramoeba flamelloides]
MKKRPRNKKEYLYLVYFRTWEWDLKRDLLHCLQLYLIDIALIVFSIIIFALVFRIPSFIKQFYKLNKLYHNNNKNNININLEIANIPNPYPDFKYNFLDFIDIKDYYSSLPKYEQFLEQLKNKNNQNLNNQRITKEISSEVEYANEILINTHSFNENLLKKDQTNLEKLFFQKNYLYPYYYNNKNLKDRVKSFFRNVINENKIKLGRTKNYIKKQNLNFTNIKNNNKKQKIELISKYKNNFNYYKYYKVLKRKQDEIKKLTIKKRIEYFANDLYARVCGNIETKLGLSNYSLLLTIIGEIFGEELKNSKIKPEINNDEFIIEIQNLAKKSKNKIIMLAIQTGYNEEFVPSIFRLSLIKKNQIPKRIIKIFDQIYLNCLNSTPSNYFDQIIKYWFCIFTNNENFWSMLKNIDNRNIQNMNIHSNTNGNGNDNDASLETINKDQFIEFFRYLSLIRTDLCKKIIKSFGYNKIFHYSKFNHNLPILVKRGEIIKKYKYQYKELFNRLTRKNQTNFYVVIKSILPSYSQYENLKLYNKLFKIYLGETFDFSNYSISHFKTLQEILKVLIGLNPNLFYDELIKNNQNIYNFRLSRIKFNKIKYSNHVFNTNTNSGRGGKTSNPFIEENKKKILKEIFNRFKIIDNKDFININMIFWLKTLLIEKNIFYSISKDLTLSDFQKIINFDQNTFDNLLKIFGYKNYELLNKQKRFKKINKLVNIAKAFFHYNDKNIDSNGGSSSDSSTNNNNNSSSSDKINNEKNYNNTNNNKVKELDMFLYYLGEISLLKAICLIKKNCISEIDKYGELYLLRFHYLRKIKYFQKIFDEYPNILKNKFQNKELKLKIFFEIGLAYFENCNYNKANYYFNKILKTSKKKFPKLGSTFLQLMYKKILQIATYQLFLKFNLLLSSLFILIIYLIWSSLPVLISLLLWHYTLNTIFIFISLPFCALFLYSGYSIIEKNWKPNPDYKLNNVNTNAWNQIAEIAFRFDVSNKRVLKVQIGEIICLFYKNNNTFPYYGKFRCRSCMPILLVPNTNSSQNFISLQMAILQNNGKKSNNLNSLKILDLSMDPWFHKLSSKGETNLLEGKIYITKLNHFLKQVYLLSGVNNGQFFEISYQNDLFF